MLEEDDEAGLLRVTGFRRCRGGSICIPRWGRVMTQQNTERSLPIVLCIWEPVMSSG